QSPGEARRGQANPCPADACAGEDAVEAACSGQAGSGQARGQGTAGQEAGRARGEEARAGGEEAGRGREEAGTGGQEARAREEEEVATSRPWRAGTGAARRSRTAHSPR